MEPLRSEIVVKMREIFARRGGARPSESKCGMYLDVAAEAIEERLEEHGGDWERSAASLEDEDAVH